MDHRFDEVIIEDIAGIVAWYGKETVVTSPDNGKSSGHFFQIITEIFGCHQRQPGFWVQPTFSKNLFENILKHNRLDGIIDNCRIT
jgi:hypothetical protein